MILFVNHKNKIRLIITFGIFIRFAYKLVYMSDGSYYIDFYRVDRTDTNLLWQVGPESSSSSQHLDGLLSWEKDQLQFGESLVTQGHPCY